MLGQGGYGDVWLGEMTLEDEIDSEDGRSGPSGVAVKILRQATGTKEELTLTACQLARELKVWAGLLHPNILELYGFYLSDSLQEAWLVSPYQVKGNLTEFLQKENPDPKKKLELVFDTICGLYYLHTHSPTIVHGDIKPANILVSVDEVAKLCDFGLARALNQPTGLTTDGIGGKGTTRYMSPELFGDDSTLTLLSDIWALGCIAGEVLTGHVPYHRQDADHKIVLQISLSELPIKLDCHSLPPALQTWILSCWKAVASERPKASDCIKVLEQHISETFPDSSRLHQSDDPTLLPTPSQTDDFFVDLHREKLKKQAKDHPKYAETLTNLAFALTARFEADRNFNDLNESITLHRQALQLRPADHPNHLDSVVSLEMLLSSRFKTGGGVMDIGGSTDGQPTDIDTPGDGEDDENASGETVTEVEACGGAKDLDESIALGREALQAFDGGHPDRVYSISRLAWALSMRSITYGDINDANETIQLEREGLQLCPPRHPYRPFSLNGLGWALCQMWELSGSCADLEEAVIILRESLRLCPVGDSDRNLIMDSLGLALWYNFRGHGDPKDLSEAIKLMRKAVQLTSPERESYPDLTEHLGTALRGRFQLNGDAKDIESAIELHREALRYRPGRHAYRFDSLLALGNSLRARDGCGDLQEVRLLYKEALKLVPGQSPGNLRRQAEAKVALSEVEAAEKSAKVDHVTQQLEGVGLDDE